MTMTGFLAYSAALALAVAVPGPGIVAMVARGLGSGFRATLPFTIGIALGDLVYLTAAVLGPCLHRQDLWLGFYGDQICRRSLSSFSRLQILDGRRRH